MKMNELFTAHYSDHRTAYEKPLEWIYAHQGAAHVDIQPTIWLRKTDKAPIYFVDYVSDSLGCTLASFDDLRTAWEYRERIGQMTKAEFEHWLESERR